MQTDGGGTYTHTYVHTFMSSIILQSARAEVLVMERFTLTSMLRVITTTCCMLATSSRPYTEHTHTHTDRQTTCTHTHTHTQHTHTHTQHTHAHVHTHTHTVHSYIGKEDTWLHTYMYMYINEILLRCTVRTALASRDNMHTYKMCR